MAHYGRSTYGTGQYGGGEDVVDTPSAAFQHSDEFRIKAQFKTKANFAETMQRLRSGGGWRNR